MNTQQTEADQIASLRGEDTFLLGLHEEYECDASEQAVEDFVARHPAVVYYDRNGRYIGAVRNENGWTA